MKRIIYTLFFIIGTVTLGYSQTPEFEWAKNLGGFPLGFGTSAALDGNGNFCVTGYFFGNATFGDTTITSKGSYDIFIAKYNADGELLWVRSAGGNMGDISAAIAVDNSGNIFITGTFQGSADFSGTTLSGSGFVNLFVTKYDPSGNVLWSRAEGSADAEAGISGNGIAVDGSGNCYVSGFYTGSVSFDNDPFQSLTQNIFIVKYDGDGNFKWVQTAGGDNDDAASKIAADVNGNIYVTGNFSGTINFSDNQLTSISEQDIFIAKYDNSGSLLWVKSAGGDDDDSGIGIAVDGSGNSYITGFVSDNADFGNGKVSVSGANDIFVAKYDAAGNFMWVKTAGGVNTERGSGITVDKDGNIHVTGTYHGTSTFGSMMLTNSDVDGIFIAKYNDAGDLLWVKSPEGDGGGHGSGIVVDIQGNDFITGDIMNTITFGSTQLTALGINIFIAKLSNPAANFDEAPEFQWVKNAGSSGTDIGNAITVDKNGNTYVTGYFIGNATFGNTQVTSHGSSDIFVTKYDASGNFLWVKTAGGTYSDIGEAIAADNDGNVFVAGYFSYNVVFGDTTLTTSSTSDFDIFIAKYDASGNLLWVRQAGGLSGDVAFGLAIDGSGNCFVTGSFQYSATFGTTSATTLTSSGNKDVFIAKYDRSGNFLWAQKAGGTEADEGRAIAVDADGNSYITGSFQNSATFRRTGDITLAGGMYDVFIAKYDASGNLLWAQSAGGTGYDVGYGIAVDGNGNNYITGYFSGTATFGNGSNTKSLTSAGLYDAFVAKYDAMGNVLWAQSAGGTQYDYGQGIIVDGSGNSYITGFFQGEATFGTKKITSSGSYDIFVAKYDASGNFSWVQRAGGTLDDRGQGITIDRNGNLYVAGTFTGNATFGNIQLTGTSGSTDIFIAKLSGQGALPLQLFDLSASIERENVLLQWNTATESNTGYFEIERSADGNRFNVIGRENAAGNSSMTLHYRFIDEHPVAGNNFYRLKMVDKDGSFTYSPVMKIRFNRKSAWTLSPVPATSHITLRTTQPVPSKTPVIVYNSLGKTIGIYSFEVNAQSLRINVGNWAPGVYYLKMSNAESSETLPFVVK